MTMHGAWTKCIVRVLSTCIDAIGEVGLTFHPVVLYQKPAIGAYYAWSTVERILRLLPSASSLKLTFPNAEFEEFIPGWKSSISFHALDRLTLWANPRHLVGFLSKLEVPMITKLVLESYSTGPQIANDAPRGEISLLFPNLQILHLRGIGNWMLRFLGVVQFCPTIDRIRSSRCRGRSSRRRNQRQGTLSAAFTHSLSICLVFAVPSILWKSSTSLIFTPLFCTRDFGVLIYSSSRSCRRPT